MMQVRPATVADAETIQAQRDAMFLDMGADPQRLEQARGESLAWHRRMLESELYNGFLLVDGEEVVGGAGLLWQERPLYQQLGFLPTDELRLTLEQI